MAGARTEKRDVPPFVTVDGFIEKVRYRHSTSAKFQDIDANGKVVVVPADDLRTIPRHEIGIVLDAAVLPQIYKKQLDKLALVVLTRDEMLKKEHVLYQSPIPSLPEKFVLDPARLQQTSSHADLSLEINICALATDGKGDGWPKRRGSRLTSWYLNISNHSKGPKFPWLRKTAEEFKTKGLPATSTYYVHLLGDPAELLNTEETTLDDLLEVWVHEDVWVVLQQSDVNLGIGGMQRLFVTQVALQILELLIDPLRNGVAPAEKSVGRLLVEYIAEQSKTDIEVLLQTLRAKKSSIELAPYVSTTFGVNKFMKRVLDIGS
jgi:hypothetical protein